MMGRRFWYVALFAVLLSGLTNYPAIRAEFMWDDFSVQTEYVPGIKTFGDAFFNKSTMNIKSYFRPLVNLSYMFDESLNNRATGHAPTKNDDRLAPARARLPHTNTVLVHMAATLLFAIAAKLVFGGAKGADFAALIAACVFALHPTHAETAIFITGRSDSLAMVFLLASLICAHFGRSKALLYPVAGFLFLLALFSKETALTGLVVLPLFLLAIDWQTPRKALLAPLAAFGCATAAYFALRLYGGFENATGLDIGISSAIGRLFGAMGYYAAKTLLPYPVEPYVPALPPVWQSAVAWVFLAGAFALAAIAFRRGRRVYAFCAAWFVVTLLPSLAVSVTTLSDSPVAERYLYIPSAAFALALGALWLDAKTLKLKWGLMATVLPALVCYAAISNGAAREFNSDFNLWYGITRQEGANTYALPWINLGNNYISLKNLDAAEECFNKAISPGYVHDAEDMALSYNGLGVTSFNRGQMAFEANDFDAGFKLYAKAVEYHQKAAQMGVHDWVYDKNLGLVKLKTAFMTFAATRRMDPMMLVAAKRDLFAALMKSPGNPAVLQLIGEANSYEKLITVSQ